MNEKRKRATVIVKDEDGTVKFEETTLNLVIVTGDPFTGDSSAMVHGNDLVNYVNANLAIRKMVDIHPEIPLMASLVAKLPEDMIDGLLGQLGVRSAKGDIDKDEESLIELLAKKGKGVN